MSISHDSGRPARIREPVQVYLAAEERERLQRLTEQLDASKSDVLRKGLEALERELLDPERHPALAIVGLTRSEGDGSFPDAAREHDRVLSDTEERSWHGGRSGR
jgi:Arc/MetJ-type ribon-helix-helix transcriptional regulator